MLVPPNPPSCRSTSSRLDGGHVRALAIRVAFATVLIVGLLAIPAAANETISVRQVVWSLHDDASGCASAASIQDRIREILGRDPISEQATRWIDSRISRNGNLWAAEITLRDGAGVSLGTRRLTSEAPDCVSIEKAAVLAIALTIDPDAVLGPVETPLPSPSPASPPPVPVSSCLATSPMSTEVRAAVTVTARAGVSWGLLPKPAAGTGLSVDSALGHRMSFVASSLWLPGVRTSDNEFSFGITAFSLGGCADAHRFDKGSIALCSSFSLGSVHAAVFRSPNLEPSQPGDWTWGALSVMPRLRWIPISPLTLDTGIELFVPLVHRSFLVTGREEPAFRQSLLDGYAFMGMGLTL